jgi:hypothetical protein
MTFLLDPACFVAPRMESGDLYAFFDERLLKVRDVL